MRLPHPARYLALILTTTLFAACDLGTNAETGATVVGTYRLTIVNGVAVPGVLSETATEKFEVLEGSLTLNADRSFAVRFVERTTTGGAAVTREETSSGSYLVLGTQITFVDQSAADEVGLIQGDTVTITFLEAGERTVLVFEKS